MRRIVVGLGGNALLRRGESPDVSVQLGHIRDAAPGLAGVANDSQLVIVHGNGPQVGMLAMEREGDVGLTTTYPLDVLVAETGGFIGYWLQQAIGNAGLRDRITTVITQTVVDAADPAFAAPTKFIGRVYSEQEAHELASARGWTVAADGDKWRRVVASPAPVRVVESSIVEDLLALGVTVICAGGAGSAVVEENGQLRGVDAVVDKDHVAALLAVALRADLLVLLTDVAAVMVDFGTPAARPIGPTTVAAMESEDFAMGSMGPKVTAACFFAKTSGKTAAIGSLDDMAAVIAGTAGTQIAKR